MAIVKVKFEGTVDCSRCEDCPFVQYETVLNEYGEWFGDTYPYCGLTNRPIPEEEDEDWDDSFTKLDDCPVIEVTEEDP